MADWTVLGIAALGTVGTISAGVLGFAGPSWNERRIQAARDHKELRQAIRLVKGELTDILSALRTRDESADDRFGQMAAAFSLIPAPDETEWHQRRETIALLVDDEDEDAWNDVIMFHILLNQFVRFLEPGPDDAVESDVESVAQNYPTLIERGEMAERQLDALLARTRR
jgi:hypothetical protein